MFIPARFYHGKELIISRSFSANGTLAPVTNRPKIPKYLKPAMLTSARITHATTMSVALFMNIYTFRFASSLVLISDRV